MSFIKCVLIFFVLIGIALCVGIGERLKQNAMRVRDYPFPDHENFQSSKAEDQTHMKIVVFKLQIWDLSTMFCQFKEIKKFPWDIKNGFREVGLNQIDIRVLRDWCGAEASGG